LVIEQDNAGPPCGPGELRLKCRGSRTRADKGGKYLALKAFTPSGTKKDEKNEPDCEVKNTRTLRVELDDCFPAPPSPQLVLEWTDCDGATGSIDIPLGAALIRGCSATTSVGSSGTAAADSLGSGWKNCSWRSLNETAVEINYQTGKWTAKAPGTAWIILTCTRNIPAEGRKEQVVRRFKMTVT